MEYICTNERINNIIRNHVTEESNIVSFLMEQLSLSRESTYRRLRGEVAYTTQEISILFSKINFAIEDLFGSDDKAYFCFDISKSTSKSEDYVNIINKTISVFHDIGEDQFAKVYYVGNKIPNSMFLEYDILSKLRYIKWVHQSHSLAINTKFSDFKISPKVIEAHKEYVAINKKISHFTVIIDNNIIQAVINTIKFYYRRNLFTTEEILEIKKELFLLVESLENILRTGKDMYNTEYAFYLSDLNIESNLLLIELEQKMSVHFLSTGRTPFVTTNPMICDDRIKWIKAVLKSSVLMTKSNEILQSEFIKSQYNLIEKEINSLLEQSC